MSYSSLLDNILQQVVTQDFPKEISSGNEPPKRNITMRDVIVVVIDVLIRIVNDGGWGLSIINGFPYAYTGQYWTLIDKNELKRFLGDAARQMGVRRTVAKYFQFQDRLYLQLLSVMQTKEKEKESERTLINLQNGTLEVTQQGVKVRGFMKDDQLTYQLPFPYDAGATCPLFMRFLDRVLPDKTLQNILAEYIGYVLARYLKLEKCLLLYGSGANGKSVFYDIICALLGKENISNFTLSDLNQDYNRALIANKLLNYGSEIKSSIDVEYFKLLTSGETVQCRLKYGNSFMMYYYARLCFNSNELPRDVEHNEAFFRRFLIVPFDVTIPEEERNPQLAKQISETELSGVFNWVLMGLNRLLEAKEFTRSDKVKEVISSYKKQSDSVYLFLEEYASEEAYRKCILIKYLYPIYRSFCQNDGYKPLSKIRFSKRLKILGFEVERKNIGMEVDLSGLGRK